MKLTLSDVTSAYTAASVCEKVEDMYRRNPYNFQSRKEEDQRRYRKWNTLAREFFHNYK